jgi:uncharacterized protein YciI
MAPDSEYEKLPEMSSYVVGLYRRVANRRDIPEDESDRIQEGHMAKIRQMTEQGDVITAGPFEEDGDLRGLMIFSTGSVERARELFAEDPAIQAGRIVLEFHTWYGPAGLRVVPTAQTAPRVDSSAP